jgi:hypothetical protein
MSNQEIGGLADLVLARLQSTDGRYSWRRSISRGIPRAVCLVDAVQAATGLERYEDLVTVMDEVDARILSGALLESPKAGPARAAAVVGPSGRTGSGAVFGRLL